MGTLEAYAAQLSSVTGWLTATDLAALRHIDAMQRSSADGGDILEIGVYYGKSAIALGYLRQPDERLVLCDVFEDNPKPGYRGPDLVGFESTFARFHDWAPTIHQCSSLDLAARESERRFRLVHIDGSHSFPIVAHDIRTAKALLVPGGVVVLDDYRTLHRPGVAAATWSEMVHGELRPFAVSSWKLYATWADDARGLSDAFMDRWSEPGTQTIRHELFDVDVVVVRPEPSAPPSTTNRLARAVLPPVALTAGRRLRARVRTGR